MNYKEVIKKPGAKLLKRKRLIVFAVVLLTLVGGIVDFGFLRRGSAANDFLTAKIDQGDIRNTVSATGTVQAVTTVQVGAQVSGQVSQLFADYNSVVHAGQVVAKLDPASFNAMVQQAQANVSNSQAGIKNAQASLSNAQAGLLSAKANADALKVAQNDALSALNRNKELLDSGVLSTRDMEVSQAAYDSAVAKYNQSVAQISQADAQVKVAQAALNSAQAMLQQNQAALKEAQINLDYTVIKTPIDGVVVSRSVDIGQTVAASLQAPTLFTIANDLREMQVIANIDEADIGKISDKTDVRFTVDAYPGQQFKGTIAEIRLNSQTAQNVVTYNVVISVDNTSLKLKPGMTANITLGVGEADHVIRVPNSALRYKPQGDAVNNVIQPAANNGQQQPAVGSKGSSSGASQTNRFANIDTTGMSPQDVDIVKKLSDRSLSSDDRRGLMQQLSDDARQKVREQMQMGGGRQQGQQPGGDNSKKQNTGKGNSGVTKDAVGVPVQKGYVASGISPEAAQKIQFPEPRTDVHRQATIWTLDKNNKLTQHNVTIGLTDGQYTEIVSGDLKDGDIVVIGQTVSAGSAKPATPAASPFGGGGGGGGQRGR